MKEYKTLQTSIVENGYCIGCGVCKLVDNEHVDIIFKNGCYQAEINEQADDVKIKQACPFSSNDNENSIASELFGSIPNINHDSYCGYFIESYAVSVKSNYYRETGSSGGMGTWLCSKLLTENMVDYVIHVKNSNNGLHLFRYAVSDSVDQVFEGAKSKYYPVEMSEVISFLMNQEGRYVIVGVPCFIKAIRLLSKLNPLVKERVKYTIGLVCGHLKSSNFSDCIAWELGVSPGNLGSIDFRVKNSNAPASRYDIEVRSRNGDSRPIKQANDMFYSYNWGYGLFKYMACEYCDDVLNETADVSIGDAWVPEYSSYKGTNILTVRSEELYTLLQKHKSELSIDRVPSELIIRSQSAGFRHRREGLSYRLFLKDENNEFRPKKRVQPKNNQSKKRKKIYNLRLKLIPASFDAYNKAVCESDFDVFIKELKPLIDEYNQAYKITLFARVLGKLKRILQNKDQG